MQVTIPDSIQKDSNLAPPVEEATEYLQTEFVPSVLDPTVRWKLSHDFDGSPLLELELTEETDSVSQRFTAEELTNRVYVERRVRRLWDQLLGKKADRHLNRVSELFREMQGNGSPDGD